MAGEQFPQDGWVEWSGGECPVAPGTQGFLRLRDGYETQETSLAEWRWTHVGDASDIIAYRVVKP